MHAHPSLPRNNNLKRISFIPPLPKPRTLIVIIASQSAYWRTTTTRPHPPFPRGVFISGHGDLQKGFIRFHFLPKTRLSLSTCRLQGPAPEDRVPAFLPSLKATRSNHKKGANKKKQYGRVSLASRRPQLLQQRSLCNRQLPSFLRTPETAF